MEGDIKACFDEISHSALLERMRARIGDKRVLGLVKAFLKSGILGEDRRASRVETGAPQGGILSPLLSNIALSVLDEHFAEAWEEMGDSHAREQRRRKGLANYRLVRYADDWVVMVAGTRADAERLRDEAAAVLLPMGLRLSEEKTVIVHIDQGFDFLGMRIQRHKQRGSNETLRLHLPVPSRPDGGEGQGAKRHPQVNEPVALRPRAPAQPGASRMDQLSPSWGVVQDLLLPVGLHLAAGVVLVAPQAPQDDGEGTATALSPGWWPEQDEVTLFNPATVAIVRYRYRGTAIPSPWATRTQSAA